VIAVAKVEKNAVIANIHQRKIPFFFVSKTNPLIINIMNPEKK